jgi:hypothetical protein
MKFTLEIEMGSDAMQSATDVMFALQNVRRFLVSQYDPMQFEPQIIRDENGNRVGSFSMQEVQA